MTKEKIPIIISGGNGTGKSTLGKNLSKAYRMKFIRASDIHRKIFQKELKLKEAKNDQSFWETAAAKKMEKVRSKSNIIDKQVDKKLKEYLRAHPHTVTDSRLMPWLYKGKALRIWIQVSDKEAGRRVAERDHLPAKEVQKKLTQRFKYNQKLWKKMYGIEYGKDFSPFDLVINTEGYESKDTFRVVKAFIDVKLRAMEKTRH